MVERLLHTLQILAGGSAERQGSPPDDVLLDCADAVRLVIDCPQIQLTAEQQALLEALDDELETLTVGGREGGAAGDSLRRLATAALNALTESG